MSFRLRTLFIVIAILSLPLAWAVNTFRPKSIFERFTGLSLPDSAIILQHTAEETGAFGSDSYRCILVQVDPDTIRRWLEVSPLNGATRWKTGPVAEAVLRARNCVPNDILDSNVVQYALDSYRQGRGHLVVLDPRSAKAWLLMW
jgi:hypothetical protein